MKTRKNTLLTHALIASCLTGLTTMPANASSSLFEYNTMSSASALRAELLNDIASVHKVSELECGSKKDSTASAKPAPNKTNTNTQAAAAQNADGQKKEVKRRGPLPPQEGDAIKK